MRAVRRAVAMGAVALLGLPGGAGAATLGDADDAAGPLDVTRAGLDQRAKRIELALAFGERPRTGTLNRFPARVGGAGSRYLCLEARSHRAGRRLLCLGRSTGRRVHLGLSKVDGSGHARRIGVVRSRVSRDDARGLVATTRLRLMGLRPGRIRWRVLSGWTGPPCESAAAARAGKRRPGRARIAPPAGCLDRVPDGRLARLRVHRVRRAGCTRDEHPTVFHGSRERARVALTFDDGPSDYTSQIISILDDRHAEGTFSVVGSQVAGRERVLRRALRSGNDLANHANTHSLSPSAADMRLANNRIESATGFRPCVFRPPYGNLGSGLVAGAWALGMATVMWDVDTRDWTNPGASAIVSAVGSARPGSIILMHDGGGYRGQTVAALPSVISSLRARGLEPVTVTRLLGERYRWREVR